MKSEHVIGVESLFELSMNLHELCKNPRINVRESSISITQLRVVLIIVHFAEEGLTIKQLSLILKLSSGATSKLVDRVVKSGQLLRVSSPEDRRSVRLYPAPQALKNAKYHGEQAALLLANLMADTSDAERDAYLAFNQKFNERICRMLKTRADQA